MNSNGEDGGWGRYRQIQGLSTTGISIPGLTPLLAGWLWAAFRKYVSLPSEVKMLTHRVLWRLAELMILKCNGRYMVSTQWMFSPSPYPVCIFQFCHLNAPSKDNKACSDSSDHFYKLKATSYWLSQSPRALKVTFSSIVLNYVCRWLPPFSSHNFISYTLCKILRWIFWISRVPWCHSPAKKSFGDTSTACRSNPHSLG